MYPETHLHSKPPRRPRHAEGMKQVHPAKMQPKMSQPKAGRIMHGKALTKALMGIKNKKHSHDGSK